MEFNATFLVSAISFIVFVFLMNMIFYAPLEKIMTEREKLVKDTLNDAQKYKQDAEKLLLDRDLKLSQAADESKKIINDSVKKANIKAKEQIDTAKANSVEEINTKKAKLQEEHDDVKSKLAETEKELAKVISQKVLGI